jgi:hypothetical protein
MTVNVFDVVVNSDDIVVLAPPAVIDVGVDFGPQGQRGATFYAGSGNPNDETVAENVFGDVVIPINGDVYINTSAGANYGWLYIYNPKISGDDWDQVLRMTTPMYTRNIEATFTSGTTTLTVPESNIIPPGVIISSAYDYVVNISAINSDPTLLTISSQTLSSGNLEVVLQGIKYSSSTWSELDSETIDVATVITVV